VRSIQATTLALAQIALYEPQSTGGSGPIPSSDFIIWVNKGGNDTTGTGTDEAPYLTIGKGLAVAKTVASPTQGVLVWVGPGDYSAESPVLPPFVSLMPQDSSGDFTFTGDISLDPSWTTAGADPSSAIGEFSTGNIAIDFTGTNTGLVTLVGTTVSGNLVVTGDPATGGEVFTSFETEVVGTIVITAADFTNHGLIFDSTLSVLSTAAQSASWTPLASTSFTPTTVTIDSTAGNTVTVRSQGTSWSNTLVLKGAGTSYTCDSLGIPVVDLLDGAPAPILISPLLGLNSRLLTGLAATAGFVATADGAGNITWSAIPAAAAGPRAYYGDKSDGNINVIGTLTLARDMFYNTLTVGVGTTVKTNGFRIYADTIHLNGTIDNSGGAAAGLTHGSGAPGGTVFGGTDGADGIVATIGSGDLNGTPGSNATIGGGNDSGVGGQGGTGGIGVGGVGGTQHVLAASFGDVRVAPQATLGAFIGLSPVGGVVSSPISVLGGTGGGSGGGHGQVGNSNSGGGGGGGGTVIISCRVLDGTGTLSANGGPGGAAPLGTAGGGGGGGGGLGILTVGNETGFAGTTSFVGGAGGAGIGGGTAGAAGTNGTLITVPG